MSAHDRELTNRYADYLLSYVTENKRSKFEEILLHRTRYLTVVLEDIYQPQNASAVLRTCDCLGIQDVHIIENRNAYKINPDVALGSDKWLTMHRYSQEKGNTEACLTQLRKKGYRIIVTTPHKNEVMLQDLSLARGKFAIVFGNEKDGISESAIGCADEFVKIPMYGFTESYNISVSAAIVLSYLTDKLRNSGIEWFLTDDEKTGIRIEWAKKVILRPEIFEKEFFKRIIKGKL